MARKRYLKKTPLVEARELFLYAVKGKRVKDTGRRIPTQGMPSSLRTYFKP